MGRMGRPHPARSVRDIKWDPGKSLVLSLGTRPRYTECPHPQSPVPLLLLEANQLAGHSHCGVDPYAWHEALGWTMSRVACCCPLRAPGSTRCGDCQW